MATALLACLALAGCGDGSNGKDGVNGAPGTSMLVRTVAEPAGANCSAGGQKLELGADVNGNGQLDDGEVQQTRYVCNGIPSKVAVRAVPIAAGDGRCGNGGYALLITGGDSGADQEVAICNGDSIPGPPGPVVVLSGQFTLAQTVKGEVLTCDSVTITASASKCTEPKIRGFYILDLREFAKGGGLSTLCSAATGNDDRSPLIEGSTLYRTRDTFYAWDDNNWRIASDSFYTYERLTSISCAFRKSQ